MSERPAESSAAGQPLGGLSLLASLPGRAPSRARSALWTALKFAVTGLILYHVFHRVDLGALAGTLLAARPALVVLAIAIFMLSPLLGGLRWWIILRAMGANPRMAPVTASYWIGILFSQILPAVASDGVRVWILTRQGTGLRTVIHSVVLERAFMLGTLLLLVVGSEPLLLHRLGSVAAPWIGPLILAAGLGGWGFLLAADHVTRWIGSPRLLSSLAKLSLDCRKVTFSSWLVPLLVLSLAANLNFVLAATALGASLNLSLSLADYLAFFPWVVVAMILPISISGWGVREGLLVSFLATVGVPAHTALAFSLLYGACNAFSSLPGLALWWFNIGWSGQEPTRTG